MKNNLRTASFNNRIIKFTVIIGLFALLLSGCQQVTEQVKNVTNSAPANTNSAPTNTAANTPVNQPETTPLSRESAEPENRAENPPVNQPETTPHKMTVTQATRQEKEEIFQLFKKYDNEIKDKMLESFTVRKMDLNSDGQPEYVAVLEDETICGTHANCPQAIYDKKGGEYNLLLETRAQVIKLEKNSTKGYLDLRTELGDTASSNFYYIYKFGGEKYQARKCVEVTYDPKEKETPIDCNKQ